MNLKKLLCLLLALAMVVCLVACDSSDDRDDDDDEKSSDRKDKDDKDRDDEDEDDEDVEVDDDPALSDLIVGSWACELNFDTNTTPGLEEVAEMGIEMQFDLSIIIEFTEDGEVYLTLDADKAEQSAEELNRIYVDALMDYLEVMAEESGMSLEDLEEAFVQENGMTLREYAETIAEEVDLYGTLADGMDVSGDYEVDDEEMTVDIDGEVVTVEIKGDNLTIVSAEDEDVWLELGFTFPVKLERID